MQIQPEKAPFVKFEMRAVEDRTASLASGDYITKDIPFVYITPPGSKDRIEREAEDWFQNLKQQVKEERMDPAWLRRWQEEYQAWKSNEELPLIGTSIKNWAVLSPAQRENMLRWQILTVETLATANEEVISRLGMGGRTLVQKAKDFLEAKGPNQLASELEKLRAQVAGFESERQQLAEQNRQLDVQIKALSVPVSQVNSAKSFASSGNLHFLETK